MVNLLYSDDVEAVYQYFCSPYSIVIGTKYYTPSWLYQNTWQEYHEAGITSEMLEPKMELYREKYTLSEYGDSKIPDRIQANHTVLKEYEDWL